MDKYIPDFEDCKKRPSLWVAKSDDALIILYPNGTNEFEDVYNFDGSIKFLQGGFTDYFPHPESGPSGYDFVDWL